MTREEEIKRRRTFAIVSHPDAGKTTLTEKLLLFGGAIQTAGAVKSNKIKKGATSDFMEIERQRGISVATSVMGFEYQGKKVNILDTPGHKDFAEDTFRTLTAVDSVIVVIDVAKGVEEQTEKLVEVCRMGKEPFDLLDEIEQKLKLNVRPLSWPIGMGKELKGVYNMYEEKLNIFTAHGTQDEDDTIEITDLSDGQLDKAVGQDYANELRENVELFDGVYEEFDREEYLKGKISPVFFGSAINNFGVKELLECFLEIAPAPGLQKAEDREVNAFEDKFSGFVFKIHANMDPNHRNRLAFVKICSGKFERKKNYLHVRNGKNMRFSSPTSFMASKKEIVDISFPGDIVGVQDTGNFKIGDTLTEGDKFMFKGLPSFSPELFKYIENADPMKSKQLAKGIDQLMDEGVAQLFTLKMNGRKIIGCVGALQFEVIQHRLEHEYGAKCRYEPINLYKACWMDSTNKAQLESFKKRKYQFIAEDKHGNEVFLADSMFSLNYAKDNFPEVEFFYTSEMQQL